MSSVYVYERCQVCMCVCVCVTVQSYFKREPPELSTKVKSLIGKAEALKERPIQHAKVWEPPLPTPPPSRAERRAAPLAEELASKTDVIILSLAP